MRSYTKPRKMKSRKDKKSQSQDGTNTGAQSRQSRRRKILENAKSRMDRLKRLPRSPQQCKSDETGSSSLHFESNVVGEVNYEDVLLQFPMDLIPDPPDELIPKYSPKCSPVNETDVASSSTLDSVQKRSMLSSIVTCFSTERAWKMRTLLTVLYGVVAGLIECWTEVVYSHVVVMVLLDSGYLLYLVFTYDPTRSDTSVDPMGKLSLLKVPLMLIYSSFTWFDPLCLSVLLVGQFLYDLVIMLFVFILLRSMLLLLI